MSAQAILAVTLTTLIALSAYNIYSKSSSALKDDADWKAFDQWRMNNGKAYGNPDEVDYRFGNFVHNKKKVESVQSEAYSLALNKFADLSSEEFAKTYLGLKKQSKLLKAQIKNYKSLKHIQAPSDVDWVSEKKVNAVQNQGGCGSCWAFSATAALESHQAINNGNLQKFSEQALVDCSRSYGNEGCNGGIMDAAFDWAADYGMALESQYPYTGKDGTCQIDNGSKTLDKVNTSYTNVPSSNQELVNAISQQPVSVAIAADAIMLYDGGIFDDWNCGTQLDHGVVAVGYGVDAGKMFYKVRNSWGSDWGESGYIRFDRKDSGTGMCGITLNASYPTS